MERWVRLRARDRCEYCGVSQLAQEATFHIDHVHPRKDGGATEEENLALACVSCSLRKGARTMALDPGSGALVALFHPRQQRWDDHFELLADCTIRGRTPTGRATVELLRMNRANATLLRGIERRLGWR